MHLSLLKKWMGYVVIIYTLLLVPMVIPRIYKKTISDISQILADYIWVKRKIMEMYL